MRDWLDRQYRMRWLETTFDWFISDDCIIIQWYIRLTSPDQFANAYESGSSQFIFDSHLPIQQAMSQDAIGWACNKLQQRNRWHISGSHIGCFENASMQSHRNLLCSVLILKPPYICLWLADPGQVCWTPVWTRGGLNTRWGQTHMPQQIEYELADPSRPVINDR